MAKGMIYPLKDLLHMLEPMQNGAKDYSDSSALVPVHASYDL